MLTVDQLSEAVSEHQQKYVSFMLEHVAEWRTWAELSDRMAAGEKVAVDEVPEFFQPDYEWVEVVLDMSGQGAFNWNDPRIAGLFAKAVQTPFYKLWGETITELALAIAGRAGVRTLLEIGAGRGNLSGQVLAKLESRGLNLPLFISDAHETVLGNLAGLRHQFPAQRLTTVLWDVNVPPPAALMQQIEGSVLLYERASLTYANFKAIENLAQTADYLVLGDYFNYTGELFAYDLIFEKIGLKPLMYRDIKPLLDTHFPNQYIVDGEVTAQTGLPNVSLIVAWK